MSRPIAYLMLIISILFVAAGIGMVATETEGGWPGLLFFGLCAVVFVGQLWPGILRQDGPSPHELLARFPGPVELRTDRRKTALLLAGTLVFGGVIFWMLLNEPLGTWRSILMWPGVILCAVGAPVIAVLLIRGGGLRLTGETMEIRHVRGPHASKWHDLGLFSVGHIPPSFSPMVLYDDASKASGLLAGANTAMVGRNSGLPDSYGMSHEELADLLNAWRAQALGQSTEPKR